MSVVQGCIGSVVVGESPTTAFPPAPRWSSGSLNGLSDIGPLYGFSGNPLTHLFNISPANVPSW